VGNIPALNLTTARPITPWHEVEPSDDELDSPRPHNPRSPLQVLHPSSEDHTPSTPPTPTLETDATGATMENGDRASVLSGSFMSAQESFLRAAQVQIPRGIYLHSCSCSHSCTSTERRPPTQVTTERDSRREKSLLPVLREGENSPDILDMIRRGWEKARLMNPNSRRQQRTGV